MRNDIDFEDNDRGLAGKISGLIHAIGPRAAFSLFALAVLVLGAVILVSYPDGGEGDQNVPIIRADAGEFKTLPENPGGMQVAHRDSTVFSTLNEDSDEDGIENLLAESEDEAPMERTELFAGLNTSSGAPQGTEEPAADGAGDETSIPQPIEEQIAAGTPVLSGEIGTSSSPAVAAAENIDTTALAEAQAPAVPDQSGLTPAGDETKPAAPATTTTAAVTPAPAPAAAKPPAAPAASEAEEETEIAQAATRAAQIEPAAGAAPPKGSFYVQVGAVREESGAPGEWKKLQTKYSGNLENWNHRVKRADLGAKGVFYRIQAGPVTKDKAASTCEAIKKVTPGGCLVVGE